MVSTGAPFITEKAHKDGDDTPASAVLQESSDFHKLCMALEAVMAARCWVSLSFLADNDGTDDKGGTFRTLVFLDVEHFTEANIFSRFPCIAGRRYWRFGGFAFALAGMGWIHGREAMAANEDEGCG